MENLHLPRRAHRARQSWVPLRLLATSRSKKCCPYRTALSRPALHRRSTLSWDQETGTGERSLSLTLVATRFGAACLHKRARDEQGRLGILRSGAGAFRAPALSHAEVLLGFFERVVTQLDCLSPKA